MSEIREQFEMIGAPVGDGFEIYAITAGKGNRWQFSRAVLEKSTALWNGAEVFVDHARLGAARSVRDLGGVLHHAEFDGEGIKAQLRAVGPSAALVLELGREMLAENDSKPRVGFSADVGFTADGENVREILRVYSVDLVFDPARGGAFLRALNSVERNLIHAAMGGEGGNMSDVVTTQQDTAPVAVTPEIQAMRELLDVQKEKTALAAEAQKAMELRAQMCEYLLDSGLAASKLPKPAQDRVRKQFAGKVFEPGELTAAIEDARKLVAELTSGQTVQGLRHVSGAMFNSDDQITAAVEDLFGVERSENLKGVTPHKLTGIRELYLGLTGDLDFYGGADLTRSLFQSTTATFPGLVKNAMNKALMERWNQVGRAGYDWWQKIVAVEHFNDLKQITWLIFGTIASLPSVSEGAEYTELVIGDGAETSTFTKYGGYVGVTLEAIINDDTRKLRAIPRELGAAAIRNVSSLVAAVFTDNSAVGPTMADTGALFNSTAVTTAGGHANLLTTALGTDFTAWDAVAAAVYNQPLLVKNATGIYGTGKKMALEPKYCLVPRALKAQAEALFVPRWSNVVTAGVIAPKGGPTYSGVVEPITVPEWTDATDWAAVVDPALVPGICIGEAFGLAPEIFIAGDQQSPAMFSNDESRMKVRHWIAVGVADFRPLHKSNV